MKQNYTTPIIKNAPPGISQRLWDFVGRFVKNKKLGTANGIYGAATLISYGFYIFSVLFLLAVLPGWLTGLVSAVLIGWVAFVNVGEVARDASDDDRPRSGNNPGP